MQKENHVAFKEWASIVNALREGKQILILRKGGIREESGEFQIEHKEFFLFPTYEHQNKEDLKPIAYDILDQTIQMKPDPAKTPVRYYAQTANVIHLTEESDLKRLEPYHVWSEKAIKQRFHFGRQKGLFVLPVRIFQLPSPHLIAANDPDYSGCKSWVELKQKLSTQGAQPVVSVPDFKKRLEAINSLFLKSAQKTQNPSA